MSGLAAAAPAAAALLAAAVTPAATAAPATRRTRVTLVTGASGALREAAIVRLLDLHHPPDGIPDAVLLEGLPHGQAPLVPSDTLHLHRIAPACLCCTGNLVLRVTLNRILRHRPGCLYIGVATTDHLDQLRSWLQQPPYDQLLELTPDCST